MQDSSNRGANISPAGASFKRGKRCTQFGRLFDSGQIVPPQFGRLFESGTQQQLEKGSPSPNDSTQILGQSTGSFHIVTFIHSCLQIAKISLLVVRRAVESTGRPGHGPSSHSTENSILAGQDTGSGSP